MDGCLACELSQGLQPLPGGSIFRTDHWLVEHCLGPLGLGTLVVKPKRHVTAVAELTDEEASELGDLLRRSSKVAGQLVDAEQVYNCLWSHAGGRPVHIHFVIQPITTEQMDRFAIHGPALQVAMFEAGLLPPVEAIEEIADRARHLFAAT